MKLPEATFCPLLKKDCIGQKCMWFVKLTGTNAMTGEAVDEYFCAMNALALLTAEAAQQSRQAGAAVESLRNRVAEGNQVLAAGIQMRALQDGHK